MEFKDIQNIYHNEIDIKNNTPSVSLKQPALQKNTNEINKNSLLQSLPSKQTLLQKQTDENNKKIVTYDKILSSLNMQIVNGKLQIVRENENEKPIDKKVSFQNQQETHRSTQNPIIKKQTQQQMRHQELLNQQQRIQTQRQGLKQQLLNQQQIRQQLQQQVQQKHTQQQMQQEEENEEVLLYDQDPSYSPITKQDVKRMIAMQYLRKLQEKRKIELLKPKKMNFV